MGGACVKNGIQIRSDNHLSEGEHSEEERKSQPSIRVVAIPKKPARSSQSEKNISSQIEKLKSIKQRHKKPSIETDNS